MNKKYMVILAWLLLIFSSSGYANVIYKCRSADGTVSYSQSSCVSGETQLDKKDFSQNGELSKRLEKRLDRISRKKGRTERQQARIDKRLERLKRRYERLQNSTNPQSPTTTGGSTPGGDGGGNNTTTSNQTPGNETPNAPTPTNNNPEPSTPPPDITTTNNQEPEQPNSPEPSGSDEPVTPGGGSPNETPNNSTTNVGELYGPIEFEIISWPLTKAYPEIEYNIRIGVIGGQYPYVYTLEQAPTGMDINQSTGEISWTPGTNLENTSANVRLSVRDVSGSKIEQSFSINVTKSDFYFVSANGSDSSGNGSIGNPWKTIDTAAARAGSNGILYVRGGTYRGAINLSASDCNKWIAFPGEKPVVDLNLSTISPKSDYGYIDGLEIINAQHWAFSMSGQDNWVFRRNHMHHLYDNSFSENPSFIFYWDSAAPSNRSHQKHIIQDNIFHDLFDSGTGINGDTTADYQAGSAVMYDVYKVLYENNEAYNIDGFGVKDKDHGQYNTFRGNYFHDNASTAFSLSNQYSGNNIEISYNVFIGSVFLGQESGDLGYVLFRHNTVIGQIMHKGAQVYGQDDTFVIIDNIITMKQEDKSKIIDWADGETHEAYPYLCCNEQDGQGFSGPILHRNRNLIDYDTNIIAGWGWGTNRTLEQWQALGFDVESIFADPQFNDRAARDFRPKSTSPVCGNAHDGGDIGALSCL